MPDMRIVMPIAVALAIASVMTTIIVVRRLKPIQGKVVGCYSGHTPRGEPYAYANIKLANNQHFWSEVPELVQRARESQPTAVTVRRNLFDESYRLLAWQSL